jgi:N-acetyl-gamma-glutamyl-phosphate reductase
MGVRVSIVGATGYSGGELAAILHRHPRVEITGVFSGRSGKSAPFAALHPLLRGSNGPDLTPFSTEGVLAAGTEIAFLATPPEFSVEAAPRLLDAGVRVVDISGAFRLCDAAEFEKWYGFSHSSPILLSEAVYGMTELCGPELASARLVANPGCYPTSIIMALKPVMRLIDAGAGIVCDSASGVSGAGRQSAEAYSFCEVAGGFKAYNVGKHKHEPEMRQALGLDGAADFVFAAHLLPVVRGILSTIHVRLRGGAGAPELSEAYGRAYSGKPLVGILPPGSLPELKNVACTPRIEIGFSVIRPGRAVIVSAIDNLLKGAASQAIQNMNAMLGFGGTEGLL